MVFIGVDGEHFFARADLAETAGLLIEIVFHEHSGVRGYERNISSASSKHGEVRSYAKSSSLFISCDVEMCLDTCKITLNNSDTCVWIFFPGNSLRTDDLAFADRRLLMQWPAPTTGIATSANGT